jgi:hypothetical protein
LEEYATPISGLDTKDRGWKFLYNGASSQKYMVLHSTVRSKLEEFKRKDHFGGIEIYGRILLYQSTAKFHSSDLHSARQVPNYRIFQIVRWYLH